MCQRLSNSRSYRRYGPFWISKLNDGVGPRLLQLISYAFCVRGPVFTNLHSAVPLILEKSVIVLRRRILSCGTQTNHTLLSSYVRAGDPTRPHAVYSSITFHTCNLPTNRLTLNNFFTFLCNLGKSQSNWSGHRNADVLYNNTVGTLSPFFLTPCIAHHASNPEDLRHSCVYSSIDTRVVRARASASA
jgi:hypothetical protein